MSVFFSLLFFLRLVFGAVEVTEKQGKSGKPQQGSKGSEERQGERDPQPPDKAALVPESVKAMGADEAQDAKDRKSDEMHNRDAEIQAGIRVATVSMAWIAAAQFLASVAGILFIWFQLKKAEEIGDESIRPWLSVKCALEGEFRAVGNADGDGLLRGPCAAVRWRCPSHE
jgi:hypothetical protein